jgi:hypothetical protein
MSRDLSITELTQFEVAVDGSKARLGMINENGQELHVNLPFDLLKSLIMTLPKIQAMALQNKAGDLEHSLRVIYPTGTWTIERATDDQTLILALKTPDGFEVCFALQDQDFLDMANSITHEGLDSPYSTELH